MKQHTLNSIFQLQSKRKQTKCTKEGKIFDKNGNFETACNTKCSAKSARDRGNNFPTLRRTSVGLLFKFNRRTKFHNYMYVQRATLYSQPYSHDDASSACLN